MSLKDLKPEHETECRVCGKPATKRFETVTADAPYTPDPSHNIEFRQTPPGMHIRDAQGNSLDSVNFGWVEASLCDNCASMTPEEIVAKLK